MTSLFLCSRADLVCSKARTAALDHPILSGQIPRHTYITRQISPE